MKSLSFQLNTIADFLSWRVFFFFKGILLCFGYLKVIQVSCLTERKHIVEVTLFLGGWENDGFSALNICN